MVYRENVQTYIVSRESNQLLMLKRTEERSGYWQPVCGGIEDNESIIETAKREVYEETGISIKGLVEELSFTFDYEESKNGLPLKMKDHCCLVFLDKNEDIVLSDEHVTYQWTDLDEIKFLTDWSPILEVVNYIKTLSLLD